jgi:NTE family protein
VYARIDLDRFRFISYDLVATGTTGEYDIFLYPIPGPRNASEIWIGAGYRTQLVESLYSRGIIHAFGRFPFGGETRFGSRPELLAEGWLTDVGSARLSLDLPVLPGVSLQPRGYVLSSPVSLYDDRTLESLYFRRHAGGDLGLVFESPRLWHIRLGGFSEWRWTERQQGAGVLDASGEPRGGLQMDAHLDQLDRGVYPDRGVDTRLQTRVWWTEPVLSESPMRTVELHHRGYLPVGNRVVLRSDLRADSDLNSGLAREDRFFVGGIEDFPGLLFQERSGRHALTVGAGIRAELFRLPFAIGDAGYLLLRGRIGRVWNSDIRDLWTPGTVPELVGGGMIGVGFGTPLGEVSAGVALNHDLRPVTFVLLGPTVTPGGTPWQW